MHEVGRLVRARAPNFTTLIQHPVSSGYVALFCCLAACRGEPSTPAQHHENQCGVHGQLSSVEDHAGRPPQSGCPASLAPPNLCPEPARSRKHEAPDSMHSGATADSRAKLLRSNTAVELVTRRFYSVIIWSNSFRRGLGLRPRGRGPGILLGRDEVGMLRVVEISVVGVHGRREAWLRSFEQSMSQCTVVCPNPVYGTLLRTDSTAQYPDPRCEVDDCHRVRRVRWLHD